MSNSHSHSKEVRVEGVWEEAGEEFYQENYKKNNRRNSTGVNRIPLPSQTARRNSGWKTGSGMTTGRRMGRSGTYRTTLRSLRTIDYNIVDGIPDLSDDLSNEKSSLDQLQSFKRMPISMAEKRGLKGQLQANPILKLTGWTGVEWRVERILKSFFNFRKHLKFTLFQNQLKSVESRFGFLYTTYFDEVKSFFVLNLITTIVCVLYYFYPFLWDVIKNGKDKLQHGMGGGGGGGNGNGNGFGILNGNDHNGFESGNGMMIESGNSTSSNNNHTGMPILSSSTSTSIPPVVLFNFTGTPFHYDYINLSRIFLNKESFIYYGGFNDSDPTFIFIQISIYFGFSLLFIFAQMWSCIKEKINEMHIEHTYSDVLFCGWDHFTKCKSGAEFKRAGIQGQIQTCLQNINGEDKHRLGVFGIRTCVNIITFGLTSICLLFIWHITQFSHDTRLRRIQEKQLEEDWTDGVEIFLDFLPQLLICSAWIILSYTVESMGKWEKYKYEKRVRILLLRCWMIRILSLVCFVMKFYYMVYERDAMGIGLGTEDTEGNVVVTGAGSTVENLEDCWESAFAKEIYKFLIVDMGIKMVVTFVLEPLRVLTSKICGAPLSQFHIIFNFLDLINIWALSWLGIYFTPFLPLVVSLYTFLLFFVKTCSLLANCGGSPDVYRPIKRLVTVLKVLTFILSVCALVFVITSMKPSTNCGPFKGYQTPWELVKLSIEERLWTELVGHLKCPGWSLPLMILFLCATIYYKCLMRNGEKMIATLRHLLVLEGHDKQFLFRRVEAMQAPS